MFPAIKRLHCKGKTHGQHTSKPTDIMKSIVKIPMDNSFTNKYKRSGLLRKKGMNYDNIFSTLGHLRVEIVKNTVINIR